MSYRKLQADQLFTGTHFLGNDWVLVLNEEAVVEALVPAVEAGEGIEVLEGILCPGFVNAHCHLELSHMKGMIPENTGMTGFVTAVMQQRNSTEETILTAIATAEAEMAANGIVAVGDICNTAHTLQQKLQGQLYYHNFIECTGFVPSTAENRFQQSLELFNKFAPHYGVPVSSVSMVPHAPYSVSGDLFRKIIDFPGNQLLSMHNQESADEAQFFQNRSGNLLKLYERIGIDLSFFEAPGKSSWQAVLPYFRRNQSLLMVHNVTTEKEDLAAIGSTGLERSKCFLCLCPNANLYIGNGLPAIETLMESGISIVVGTDSLASNHQLSILEELKTLHRAFPELPLEALLTWATSNGAKALQLEEIVGSFEPGKQPGVLLIKQVTNNFLAASASVTRL